VIYLLLIVFFLVVFAKASADDIKKREISNVYYISLISVTLLYKICFNIISIPKLFFSVVLVMCVCELLFTFKILGGGDAKLLFALSFALGFDFSNTFILLYIIGILLTGLVYVLIAHKKGIKNIPFVPVMCFWLLPALLYI